MSWILPFSCFGFLVLALLRSLSSYVVYLRSTSLSSWLIQFFPFSLSVLPSTTSLVTPAFWLTSLFLFSFHRFRSRYVPRESSFSLLLRFSVNFLLFPFKIRPTTEGHFIRFFVVFFILTFALSIDSRVYAPVFIVFFSLLTMMSSAPHSSLWGTLILFCPFEVVKRALLKQ